MYPLTVGVRPDTGSTVLATILRVVAGSRIVPYGIVLPKASVSAAELACRVIRSDMSV